MKLIGRGNFSILSLALLAHASNAQQAPFTVTPIGSPTWEVKDVHIFTIPIGQGDINVFLQNLGLILPPPNHVFHFQLGHGPGTAHPPPYDSEMADGLGGNPSFREGTVFSCADRCDNEIVHGLSRDKLDRRKETGNI